MQKVLTVAVAAFVVALGIGVFAEQKPATAPAIAVSHAPTSAIEAQTALVKQYCATCHNDRNKNNAAGLSLQGFDAAKVGHDPLAEQCAERLKKGSPVYLEGRLQMRKASGKDGVVRSSLEIKADSVQFLDRKAPDAAAGDGEKEPPPPRPVEGDLPF